MNTKRLFTWGSFIIIVALIIWGLIAASNKAKNESEALGPVDEVTATDWVSSTSTVPVTLIEYSDFECPACGFYYPYVERLVRENSDKMRLVYRHFPLTMSHPNALPAAKASEAAGNQGKFWEMYRMLFENQTNWSGTTNAKEVFESYAQALGLDMEKYRADVASASVEDKINNSIKSAINAGVNSTPTFFLNGEKIKNPQSYEEFNKLINDAASNNP